MFVFGFILGAAATAGVWYSWNRWGRDLFKALDAFGSGLPPKE